MAYILLIVAIVAEVTGTLSLRVLATRGRATQFPTRLHIVVVVCFIAAFSLLMLSLRLGMPLGIAYGVWTAAGVALTTIASGLLFGEALTGRMAVGILCVIAGVLMVEIGAAH
ncbi:QacE family quaternary ammonium compound efflux SMR transporter [Mycobacterium sp. CBMA293]|uniref:DMT family transporter n=1 Tax=unclassified Mycolicibacterium TaxID=2636767 RepID=UPI001324C226|nr:MULTISPECIES: SMR family transporter [unclassified Mycolicibacterium]MUL46336.1 QacE family quaternary ammonium compound efflux SMR transporter [Mycolicibacterium sp. CBMA 360]MUL92240.1 QacE family quaternary ammonium compound efflux SMR transporter [Mycolicibacterium sp. CBMA 230]MUM34609.1 QacE family quaternary ammonium compound efflux SMR transporter [Mycolicibacterium sp. CBMA 361]MUL57152.1 QacE family quaternary ammonium compound efflux SMR transporter [Mycolicibacterium sp. CBMA 335